MLDGLLFPDTYRVEVANDEVDVVTRMVATLDANATELGYSDAPARVAVSPYQAIVVASSSRPRPRSTPIGRGSPG